MKNFTTKTTEEKAQSRLKSKCGINREMFTNQQINNLKIAELKCRYKKKEYNTQP